MTVEVRPLRSAVDSGLSYEVEVGEELGVQRDRESTLHRNAVMLVAGAQPLAYLPVDAARALALEMDSGMRVVAEVDEIRATSDGRRTSLLITLHESGYGADTDIA